MISEFPKTSPMSSLITPKTHPDHPVVGHHFGGYLSSEKRTAVYFCESHDPNHGYWLRQVDNPEHRINISERAIGRTYYEAHDCGDHWSVSLWNVEVPKRPSEPITTPSEGGGSGPFPQVGRRRT
jgi:hypothetical protein